MPSSDPLSQPTHHRHSSDIFAYSTGSSPTTSAFYAPSPRSSTLVHTNTHPHAVPIPRPPSQIHRPSKHVPDSELNTPLSHSPSSSESPFPFSPLSNGAGQPASYLSVHTNITSPPSSASLNNNPPVLMQLGHALSYPSVPPPSLSSSFGSPSISYFPHHRDDPTLSPIEPLSRRSSNAAWRGNTDRSRGASRRASVEFGARVAETGSLVRGSRSRAGSTSWRVGGGGVGEDGNGVDGEAIGVLEVDEEDVTTGANNKL